MSETNAPIDILEIVATETGCRFDIIKADRRTIQWELDDFSVVDSFEAVLLSEETVTLAANETKGFPASEKRLCIILREGREMPEFVWLSVGNAHVLDQFKAALSEEAEPKDVLKQRLRWSLIKAATADRRYQFAKPILMNVGALTDEESAQADRYREALMLRKALFAKQALAERRAALVFELDSHRASVTKLERALAELDGAQAAGEGTKGGA